MRVSLLTALPAIRQSYWFVPTLMMVAAALLSLAARWVDEVHGDWLAGIEWLRLTEADGARTVLSTIAASMIGVAGVTFSMTVVSVSFAAAQFGPRLVGNFMRNRANQVTLGTFIAAFVYCLLVLRTVGDGFVPHFSVLVGVALALASVSVLIYFIHHVPRSINIAGIAADLGEQLRQALRDQFPAQLHDAADAATPAADAIDWQADDIDAVVADNLGYVQAIDGNRLMQLAVQHDLCLRLRFRPGDFCNLGDELLLAKATAPVGDHVADQLRACYAIARERTPEQNVLYLVDQLTEIVVRALSPGVNDPFTAIGCLDWLDGALHEMVRRRPPAPHRVDEHGTVRVIAYPVDFERFCSAVFDKSRCYVAGDRNAALHTMRVIAAAALASDDHERRQVLLEHAEKLEQAGRHSLPLQTDRDTLTDRLRQLRSALTDAAARRQLLDDQGWLGSSA